MIGAPISETFGRKAVYLLSLPISIPFAMATGLSQNIETVLICRFLSGNFGALAVAVGAGAIADIGDLQHGGGLATVFFSLIPFLGSALGPLIGGYTVQTRSDWRWMMWVLMLMERFVWLMNFLLEETLEKELLRRRALAQGIFTSPKPSTKTALKMIFTVILFRPLRMLLIEPIVAFIIFYVSFVFGVVFAFFDAYPYGFHSVYGFSLGQVGLAFLGIVVRICLAAFTFVVIDKTLYAEAKARAPPGKPPPPEERLYVSMLGSVGIPVSLFW